MKKILLAALAIALVATLGCKNEEPTPAAKQKGAALNYIRIDTQSASGGLGGSSVADATSVDIMELSNKQKTNAKIEAFLTPSSTKASVRYAVVKSENEEPSFSSGNIYTLVDLDIIFIRVTSEDGKTTKYYKFPVEIGKNAKLKTFTIGQSAHDEPEYLGTPAAVPANAVAGTFQADQPSAAGFYIVAVTEDEEATAGWARSKGPEPTTYGKTSPMNFEEDDYLFVRVVAADGKAMLFYKLEIILPKIGKILYGVPALDDPDGTPGSGGYIDPVWDTAGDIYEIDRVNRAEGEYLNNPWFGEPWGQHTKATAKALWDDTGIWVLTDVDFISPFRLTENGDDLVRKVFTGTNEHTNDSLEIFINERVATMTEPARNGDVPGNRNWGNQFRVGADGATSGDNTSIEGPAAPNNGTNVFHDSGEYRAWLKPNDKGYYVLAHVPFIFGPDGVASTTGKGQAADMWEKVGNKNQIKDGAMIGFELQINACSDRGGTVGGGRDGILTWNGVQSQAYQNAWSYGLVTLDLDSRTRVIKADKPSITVQPQGKTYIGDFSSLTPLTVTATLPASATAGVLSYQWYSSPTVDGAGTALGTSASLTLTAPSGGNALTLQNPVATTYYWVVVTNTDNTATEGYKTARSTSLRAPVTFSLYRKYISETVTLGSGAYAFFKFELPASKTWSDYDTITATYTVDAANLAKEIRQSTLLRLMGNYAQAAIPTATDNAGRLWITLNDNTNAPYIIYNGGPGWGTANGWVHGASPQPGTAVVANQPFTVTYPTDGTNPHGSFAAANKPAAGATGPFYFALGIPGADSSNAAAAITQKIEKVTLKGKTAGTDDVVSSGSGYDVPLIIGSGGNGENAGAGISTRVVNYEYSVTPF
jgi:hypothetical protein